MPSKGAPDDLELSNDDRKPHQRPPAELAVEISDVNPGSDDQSQLQSELEPTNSSVELEADPQTTVTTPETAVAFSSSSPPSQVRLDPPKPRTGHKPTQLDEKPREFNSPVPIVGGKRDYSKSPAELANPGKVFDSNCTICYRDISCKLSLAQDVDEVKNNFTPAIQLAKAIGTCGKSCHGNDFYRIKDASGIIRPGTMTLVLSGPGQGKSSFLRLLSNRIPLTSGTVAYNGRTFDQAAGEGCDLRKMTQYVDQVDTHLVCSPSISSNTHIQFLVCLSMTFIISPRFLFCFSFFLSSFLPFPSHFSLCMKLSILRTN
jgi:ABC-type multidrug transport system fused ATPase/permease subunit